MSKLIWKAIQHYVIEFVSDLRQVCRFLKVLQFPLQIKLTATYLTEILFKVALNTITLTGFQMVPYTFIVFILIRNPRWAPLQSKCNIILLWNLQMIGLQNYLECSLDGPLSNHLVKTIQKTFIIKNVDKSLRNFWKEYFQIFSNWVMLNLSSKITNQNTKWNILYRIIRWLSMYTLG
jgi:hypothetical protein